MPDQEKANEYLRQFGYLGRAPGGLAREVSAAPSEAVFRAALMEFQRMALMPVTGVLDQQTLAAMDRPRCGFPDRGSASPSGGDYTIITYRFENFSPDLDENIQRAVIRTACDRWSAVVPLIFQEALAGAEADIQIRFAARDHGDGSPFDGPGRVLAHAFFPPPSAGEHAGDMHYDEDERWQEGFATGGFDLLTVMVHELGHVLGPQHTDVANSTMNPFYPTPSTPAADDRAGMRDVYREHIWVASLYRDLLGRRFDDNGLDFWIRQRFSTASPEAISRAFCYSREFSSLLATELYFSLLDRAPDEAGLPFWTGALENGMSRQTVITALLESSEYLSRNAVPDAFVKSLYRRLLNRVPDAEGFAFWMQRMNEGISLADVARGFLESEEYGKNFVRPLYFRFLRREPDVEGERFWTDRVKEGIPHQDIMAAFLASDEYRKGVTGRV